MIVNWHTISKVSNTIIYSICCGSARNRYSQKRNVYETSLEHVSVSTEL